LHVLRIPIALDTLLGGSRLGLEAVALLPNSDEAPRAVACGAEILLRRD
jgi:hypothetical protein